MVGPRKLKEIISEDGSFMGIKFPQLEGVTVDLKSTQEITKSVKTGEILSQESPNFKIEISFISYNNRREDVELSAKIKEATGLSFAPYQRGQGYYHFYTSKYTNPESKLEIYQKLIKVAQEYVEEKKDEVIDYKNDFDEDYEKQLILENKDMILMPYSAQDMKNMYLLVLKEKVGASTYSFLARESFYRGYLTIRGEEQGDDIGVNASISSVQKYFPDFKRKAAFFLVGPENYTIIKTFVQAEVAKDNFYYQEQVKKAEKNIDDVKRVECSEENIFGVSIKYLEDKGVYLFKGKGYKDANMYSKRTTIGLWANNFIYAEEVSWENKISSSEFYVENCNKIELSLLTKGSAKEGYLVPLSEAHKLEKIKNNLEKELKIWGREHVLIDVFKNVLFESSWRYQKPIVYITDTGDAYLCYTHRSKFYKTENVVKCSTFKGIKLTKYEVEHFFKDHPFAKDISSMSKEISVLASNTVKSAEDFSRLSSSEVDEVFDVLMLHFTMKQDAQIYGDKKDIKKMKF